MKHITAGLLSLFILCLSQGCSTTEPTGNRTIEVFHDGKVPNRAYKEIGLLTDDGGLGEQGDIEEKMLKKAKRMGADALLFEPLMKSGGELKGFAFVETYLFKAHVVVFQ